MVDGWWKMPIKMSGSIDSGSCYVQDFGLISGFRWIFMWSVRGLSLIKLQYRTIYITFITRISTSILLLVNCSLCKLSINLGIFDSLPDMMHYISPYIIYASSCFYAYLFYS